MTEDLDDLLCPNSAAGREDGRVAVVFEDVKIVGAANASETHEP
jgi:hypothetical protein